MRGRGLCQLCHAERRYGRHIEVCVTYLSLYLQLPSAKGLREHHGASAGSLVGIGASNVCTAYTERTVDATRDDGNLLVPQREDDLRRDTAKQGWGNERPGDMQIHQEWVFKVRQLRVQYRQQVQPKEYDARQGKEEDEGSIRSIFEDEERPEENDGKGD